MMLRKFVLMVSLLALNLGFVSSKTAQAQYRDCNLIKPTNEPPSSTLRTMRLERFGIQVSIPENFRTMLLQDDTVEILHPDDFAMIECAAQGGYNGRGYYSRRIGLASPDPSLSLREQAVQSVRYAYDSYYDIPTTQVVEYSQASLSGYITVPPEGSVNFIGNVMGNSEILEVNVGCPCTITVQDLENLLTFLSRIQPLN